MPNYYLIGDPRTGRVLRRAHTGPTLNEPGIGLKVSKDVWNLYRKGDEIMSRDLPAPNDLGGSPPVIKCTQREAFK